MILQAPKIKKNFLEKLESIVGPNGFSTKNLDRFNYSRDSSFKSTIRLKQGQLEPLPDAVCWPKNTDQVARLVVLCGSSGFPIVPFGAGSGVCGGTIAVKGGLVIDLKLLHRLIRVDAKNLTCTVECGMMGLHLEEELDRRGFTLGHFPSSILCASVGGYLAARSAGQCSTRFGKIEDMVLDLEMVTGTGEILQTREIRNTDGFDLNQLILGSEGTLGLITKTTLRIFPKSEHRTFSGFKFPNMEVGIEAIRRLLQTGLKPSVVRLYDPLDSSLMSLKDSPEGILDSVKKEAKFHALKALLTVPRGVQTLARFVPDECILILMHEGHPILVEEEKKICAEIGTDLGGKDLGEEPGRHWLKHRYSVSYNASPIFYAGCFTDTIEVATTWENLPKLYHGMRKTLASKALIMAHLSHAYPDGGALYFTFVAAVRNGAGQEKLYDLIWQKALTTCQKLGGVISHHHGIGRLKAKFMNEEWGEGVTLFESFKQLYDPKGILNPGKLFVEKNRKKKAA